MTSLRADAASTPVPGAERDAGRTDGAPAARDAAPVEPDPPVNPDAIANLAASTTALNVGEGDTSITHVITPSAGAGLARGTHACGNQGTCEIWKWKQPGAYLEYSVIAPKAGTYAASVIYFAAQAGGIASISLNGSSLGTVTLGSTKDVGGYGGVPPNMSRAPGLPGTFVAGANKLRVTLSARSAPVDVHELQVNFAGQSLPDAGKVNRVSAAAGTTIAPETAADFYRNGYYQQSGKNWPCRKSFCLVEYLVEAEKAGAHEVTIKYVGAPTQCSGMEILVDGKSQGAFKIATGSGVSPPRAVQLPLGVSRLRVQNPNYVSGEFCGFGVGLADVVLKPPP